MTSSRELFEFGRISAAQDWLPAILVGTAVAAVALLLYRRDLRGLSLSSSVLLVGLRLSALALLAWVALDPRTVVETTVRHPPKVAVLVDASRSMETQDVPGESPGASRQSRWNQLAEALGSAASSEWGRDLKVQFFVFGKKLMPISGVSDLSRTTPSDDETRLADAVIEAAGAGSAGAPAAIIMATDGGQNAGRPLEEALASIKAARVPVHGILFGSETPPMNVRVADLRLPQRAFRGADDASGVAIVEAAGVEEPVELVVEARKLDGPAPPPAPGQNTVTPHRRDRIGVGPGRLSAARGRPLGGVRPGGGPARRDAGGRQPCDRDR